MGFKDVPSRAIGSIDLVGLTRRQVMAVVSVKNQKENNDVNYKSVAINFIGLLVHGERYEQIKTI